MILFGKGKFFDKIEDLIRKNLVKFPKIYALITGTAAILSWIAIWKMTDQFITGDEIRGGFEWLKVIIIGVIGILALLLTGAFINLFGDNEIIEKTLKKDELLLQKEENEIKYILNEIELVKQELQKINERLSGTR